MELTFLGTRGEIEARSKRHRMHTSLLLSAGVNKVMIDCGTDWLQHAAKLHPTAILLTHAHPDHAGGLKAGSRCPVFATGSTWVVIKNYPVEHRRLIEAYESVRIGPFILEPIPVEHSLRAPAVSFRINGRIFYAPDVASIPQRSRALAGIELYIGDGASISRPIIRKRNGSLIGHASIASQIHWCEQEGVRRAIFTHCGSQIVAGKEQAVMAKLGELSDQSGVVISLAYDGLTISWPDRKLKRARRA